MTRRQTTFKPPKIPDDAKLEDWARQVTEELNRVQRFEDVEFTSGQASGSEIFVRHNLGEIPDHAFLDISAGRFTCSEAQRRRWTREYIVLTAVDVSGATVRARITKD